MHEVLRRRILSGELAPGEAVPSERLLAEQMEVHRQSVREALKRLEQAELVRISHGGATRVLDWRETGGLDLLPDLALAGRHASAETVRSVVEMRASIGIDAARGCALRADRELRESIGRLAEDAAAVVGVDDAVLEERFAAMWLAVVAGSENVAYRLAFNTLMRSLASAPELAALVRPTDVDAIHAFGTAMAEGDPDAAVECAVRLLRQPLT